MFFPWERSSLSKSYSRSLLISLAAISPSLLYFAGGACRVALVVPEDGVADDHRLLAPEVEGEVAVGVAGDVYHLYAAAGVDDVPLLQPHVRLDSGLAP